MRNKRGERERRAVREGERTGGQWDWESSALVVIRDGGHWHRLIIAVRGGGHWHHLLLVICFRSPLTSFVTVHCAAVSVVRSCSYPSCIVKLCCVGGRTHATNVMPPYHGMVYGDGGARSDGGGRE